MAKDPDAVVEGQHGDEEREEGEGEDDTELYEQHGNGR